MKLVLKNSKYMKESLDDVFTGDIMKMSIELESLNNICNSVSVSNILKKYDFQHKDWNKVFLNDNKSIYNRDKDYLIIYHDLEDI